MTVRTIKKWSPICLSFPLSPSGSHFWVMISFTNKSFRTYNSPLWYATEFNLTVIVIKSNFTRRYTLNYHQLLFYLMLESSHCAPSNKTVHCELYGLYLHEDTGQFPLINPWSWWNVGMYVCICFPNGSIVNKVNTFVGKLSVRVFSFVYFVRTGIV